MAREGLMDDCGYNFDVDEDSYNSGFKDGFLMAVDEFAEKLQMHLADWQLTETDYDVRFTIDEAIQAVAEIAEQLKEE